MDLNKSTKIIQVYDYFPYQKVEYTVKLYGVSLELHESHFICLAFHVQYLGDFAYAGILNMTC